MLPLRPLQIPWPLPTWRPVLTDGRHCGQAGGHLDRGVWPPTHECQQACQGPCSRQGCPWWPSGPSWECGSGTSGGTLHFALESPSVCPLVATGTDWKCRWRRNLEDAPPRMPGSAAGVPVAPGSGAWKLLVEGEWLGPLASSVSCRAQYMVLSPLQAEAGRRGSFCRPGPPVGIATAASAVTPPLSHVTCSLLHSGDKWPSAQPSVHSISRSPEPPQAGAVHQLPSLRPRKRAPSWTSFLGCIRQGPLALVTRAGPWGTPRPH